MKVIFFVCKVFVCCNWSEFSILHVEFFRSARRATARSLSLFCHFLCLTLQVCSMNLQSFQRGVANEFLELFRYHYLSVTIAAKSTSATTQEQPKRYRTITLRLPNL